MNITNGFKYNEKIYPYRNFNFDIDFRTILVENTDENVEGNPIDLDFNMGFLNNLKENDVANIWYQKRNLDYLVNVYNKLSAKLSKRFSV